MGKKRRTLGFPYSYPNPIQYKTKEQQRSMPLDVITAILSRLPVRSLQKFRLVCKSWDSLIQQDRYLASRHIEHGRLRPKQGIVSLSFASRRTYDPAKRSSKMLQYAALNYSSGADPTIRNFNLGELLQPDRCYAITNSCDGLVGVYCAKSFYILNPSIRKVRAIPNILHLDYTCHVLGAGLGYDASTGEYKVVRLFQRESVSSGCEVLSLGGGNGTVSWKSIDGPPGQDCNFSLPVVVNGAIYWNLDPRRESEDSRVALSFDLSREVFGFVTHPEGSSRPCPSRTWVAELGGCLCVADTISNPSHMNIWILKDFRNSVWVKEHVIDLPHSFDQLVRPLTVDNGRIVMCYRKGWRSYDQETRSFGECEQSVHGDSQIVTPYTESIIWPWSRFCGVGYWPD